MNQEDHLAHKPTKAEQARLDAAMKYPEQRIKELEDRIAELERNQPTKIGPNPVGETPWILPIVRHPIVPEFDGCKTCGMKFDGPLGYACSHPNCQSAIRC